MLPKYLGRFSRHAFTKPQLFACPVLRGHQRKSVRGIEALPADRPLWLADIGLTKPPDHNTLSRAFDEFVGPDLADSMLDLMAEPAAAARHTRSCSETTRTAPGGSQAEPKRARVRTTRALATRRAPSVNQGSGR